MGIGTRLLLALSRSPEAQDFTEGAREWDVASALRILRGEFADFDDRIRGARVLDFGCGSGHQTVAMAMSGAAHVTGIDVVPRLVQEARALAIEHGVADKTDFRDGPGDDDASAFDVIVSQDSMEHFADARGVLELWRSLLRPGGIALVTFGPPWFAPFGAHMHYFTRVPWVQLWFSERTVMDVRRRFRDDGARRYEDVEGGLGKMTVGQFLRLVKESGFHTESLKLTAVKGIDLVTRLPLVRELLTNNVSAILRAPPAGSGAR